MDVWIVVAAVGIVGWLVVAALLEIRGASGDASRDEPGRGAAAGNHRFRWSIRRWRWWRRQ